LIFDANPKGLEAYFYLDDTLHPHGFDEIVKDDFAGLRQMLRRHR
jgi:hypothetical protein